MNLLSQSKGVLGKIYTLVVKGNQKAIAAFVVAAVASLSIQIGGTNLLDMTVGELISSVVVGALNAAAVWFKANRK